MPRRFALGLLALLVLLLLGLFVGRRVHDAREREHAAARPTPTRTIPPPPTPIPARLVTVWFESAEDGLFHAEAREVPTAVDDVASLRSLASAVLEGPRHPSLLPPFPAGWKLRAAFRLAGGLAVLDLAPPAPPTPAATPEPTEEAGKKAKAKPTAAPQPVAEPPKRWETGSSEEVGATQALVLTVTKNLPAVTHVVLLVGGEPVETLAGHVDLTHPLLPDLSRVADAAPLVAPMPTPAPSPEAAAGTPATPSPAAAPAPGPRTPAPSAPSVKAGPSPSPASAAPAPRPAARPTVPPPGNSYRT